LLETTVVETALTASMWESACSRKPQQDRQ